MNDSIIVNGITYYSKKPVDSTDNELLEKYNWLKNEIEVMLQRSQELYDQMKTDGLSIGMIEAEGYLRAAQEMQKWKEYILKIMGN